MSEKSSRGKVGRKRALAGWAVLAAPVSLILACSKIVGITDTEVGGAAGSGGAEAGGSHQGGASTTTGGSSATGSSANSGGSSASGASATGGATVASGGAGRGGAATSGGTSSGGDGTAGSDAGDGPGGAATATGGATTGGSGGKGGTGGTTGGVATTGGAGGKSGTGGTTGGTPTTGGAGGSGGACTAGSRCATAGRETCTAGQWKSDPCPLNTPACEGAGMCVVRGPTMVKVDTFYVDSTEVTAAQYQAFLAAKGTNTSGQPSVCSWNTSYYDTTIPMSPDNYPMANVDWCDATAFCSWAGKHLCGKKGGGAIARADLFTPALSQWYLACGGPNGGTHPNNNPVCNSSGGFDDVAPVATFPGCQGYYPGLYDLEGNVAEWVDGCAGSTGAADICYLMGGNTIDQKSYCSEVYEDWPRNESAGTFGFRCCSG